MLHCVPSALMVYVTVALLCQPAAAKWTAVMHALFLLCSYLHAL